MRNFLRIAQGLNTSPVLLSLHRRPDLWNQKRFRTTFEHTPHSEVDDILLRFSDDKVAQEGDPNAVEKVMVDGNSVWHEAVHQVPEIQPLVLALMVQIKAYALDRLILTRLAPGKRILPHADNQGAYVHDPDRVRHHIVLQGLPGSLYRTGDETVNMLTGEVWWFNAHIEHEVVNNSADDRIHLLVDCRTWPHQS